MTRIPIYHWRTPVRTPYRSVGNQRFGADSKKDDPPSPKKDEKKMPRRAFLLTAAATLLSGAYTLNALRQPEAPPPPQPPAPITLRDVEQNRPYYLVKSLSDRLNGSILRREQKVTSPEEGTMYIFRSIRNNGQEQYRLIVSPDGRTRKIEKLSPQDNFFVWLSQEPGDRAQGERALLGYRGQLQFELGRLDWLPPSQVTFSVSDAKTEDAINALFDQLIRVLE